MAEATTKQMMENVAVSLLATTCVVVSAWGLNYSSTYLVAGLAGLLKQTHYSNLFVKKVVEAAK